jgi:ATP sulfurylase
VGQSLGAALREMEGVIAAHQTRERELLKAIEVAMRYVASAEAHLHALNHLELG